MALYQTITIAGVDYESFATRVEANEYLAVDPGAAAWRALDDDDATRGPYLITATRILARQSWPEGVLVDPLPENIKLASIELASAMAAGYDAANQATTASGIKRQKAGSVEQEFFAPGVIAGTGGYRFPLPVWELIKGLLAGDGAGMGGSEASGTCGRDISGIDYGYGGPYREDQWRRVYD